MRLVVGCALLLVACGGGGFDVFDGGEITVAGPASWGSEFGRGGSVLEVANSTTQAVQIVDVTMQPGVDGQDAFAVIDAGRDLNRVGDSFVMPPGPLASLPITLGPGEKVDLFVAIELRSCDAIGKWHVDSDTGTVVFPVAMTSPFELHLAGGEMIETNVFPALGMLQPLEPAVCGA